MPKHTLHVAGGSAPCRSVLLHHTLLGDLAPELDVLSVDLQAGEHKSEDFLALNPLHCVPTLETPWGPLWESRAIMQYFAELAQQQAPDAWTFYPRPVYQRSLCNLMLDWDQGTFYKAVGSCVYPKVFAGQEPGHEDLDKLAEVFMFLEQQVLGDGRAYLIGDNPTIADISIAMGATMLRLADLEVDDLPRVQAWTERMEALSGWAEVNEPFEAWHASLHPASEQDSDDSDDSDEAPAEEQAPSPSTDSQPAQSPA